MNFPYAMRDTVCPTCGATRRVVDGADLRTARETMNVGLREMARRLHRSASYLSDIELNRRYVTDEILEAYKATL
jgi:predicted transcriptional regulator